jgi:alpha-L-fucosidase 2
MKNINAKLLLIIISFLSESIVLKSQTLKLWYKTQAEYFINALPVGNGRLAAMIYGRPA